VLASVEYLRSRRPKTRIVLGGPFATAMAEALVRRCPVDAVAVGEAEETLPELVKAFESGASLEGVKGLVFRRGRDVVRTDTRPPVHDLDSVSRPSYRLYDRNSYARFVPGNQHPLQRARDLLIGRRFASLAVTRGCDFSCEFCAVHVVHGRGIRRRSAASVADEMQHLHERFGYRYFFFQDAAFPLASDLSRDLCRELTDRGLDLRWAVNVRADGVTEADLRLVREAGCFYLLFGLESASEQVLDNINKQESLSQILDAIRMCRRLGIMVGVHVIVGLDGEDDSTVTKTARLLKSMKAETVFVRNAALYPGTP